MDLEATLTELAPRLLRYCLGSASNRPLAEEAAQEALTALVTRWRRHGPPESPEAFVFAVGRRRVQRARFKQRFFEPLEKAMNGRSPTPDPETQAVTRSDLAHTLGALDRLARRQREALLLVAAGELDTASAAAILGISKSALKMRVHRARRQLQQMLEERR